jgi:hypothetical protein
MLTSLRRLVGGIRFLNRARLDRHVIEPIVGSANLRFLRFAPPGHFYSPIPDFSELDRLSQIVFDRTATHIPGVNLDVESQLALTAAFVAYYGDIPFPHRKDADHRYYFDNPYFSYGDAVVLYSLMRHLRPRRIVEVGSGFSSAAMLDVSDRFMPGIEFTFIEPYPDRLFGLLDAQDRQRCRILRLPVQQVQESVFDALQENDILFVDSSHVVKAHSDVVHIVFKLLPALNKGVVVHFHDILWPFEYPQSWFEQGRAWNETYLLRGFLQYNSCFRILYFNSMMESHFGALLQRELPLTLHTPSAPLTPGNTSLWLRKEQ